jgi:hypothetical protein
MSNYFPPSGGTPQVFLDVNAERIQTVNGFVNMLDGIGEIQELYDPTETAIIDYRRTNSFISVLRRRNVINPPLPPPVGVCPIPELILDYAYGQYEASYSFVGLPFELTSTPLVSVSYIGCQWRDVPGSNYDFKSPYFNTSGYVETEGIPGTNLTLKLYASMCLPFPSSINYSNCVYQGPHLILVCVKLFKPVMNPLVQPSLSNKESKQKITSLLDKN